MEGKKGGKKEWKQIFFNYIYFFLCLLIEGALSHSLISDNINEERTLNYKYIIVPDEKKKKK